ncbi:MAG: hypothetical protein FWE32_08635 [Oscillospiraceae bacterium]|nr:hypothetical protein [Oscillospiraceae bacterium]
MTLTTCSDSANEEKSTSGMEEGCPASGEPPESDGGGTQVSLQDEIKQCICPQCKSKTSKLSLKEKNNLRTKDYKLLNARYINYDLVKYNHYVCADCGWSEKIHDSTSFFSGWENL